MIYLAKDLSAEAFILYSMGHGRRRSYIRYCIFDRGRSRSWCIGPAGLEATSDSCHCKLGCRRGEQVFVIFKSDSQVMLQYGLIGSTEWGEDFAQWIQAHAVSYVNVGM